MPTLTISVESLLLDLENPRHETVQTQAEALAALIEEQGSKIVNLARDISEYGLSPIDRLLVIKTPGKKTYTVVEGNRRLTAVKLLRHPDLADGTSVAKDIAKLEVKNAPAEIDCVVVASRQEARHWQDLRHTGEAQGRSTVPWNTFASNRFRRVPGSQASKAIAFVDAVRPAYAKNTEIQELVERVVSERLTTLGRVVADPDFRNLVGAEEHDGELVFHYPAAALEEIVQQLLEDLAGEYSVTKLKSKAQRVEYIASLGAPSAAAYKDEPTPLQVAAPKAAKASSKGTTPKKPSSPAPLFKDVTVENLGDRVEAIMVEVRKLDVTRFPNATAVLVRAVVELSVDSFLTSKSKPLKGELKTRIKNALHLVDPSDKDTQFQGVRAGLDDGSSLMSIATLHGYVHNPLFHPAAPDLRQIAKNLQPFLQAMNDQVT